MLIEERERQVGNAKPEPRAVRQRMSGEPAERLVPAKAGVPIVRLRRHMARAARASHCVA